MSFLKTLQREVTLYDKFIIQLPKIIDRLFQYFFIYFTSFSSPTAEMLFLLILSILATESADSICSLYRHFLSSITKRSFNTVYYAYPYAKVDYSRFMNVTSNVTLSLIPDSLKSLPVFLCIDDTMVSKFGKKFEDVSKLFDHAAHNGSNYLNGHYFVSVMLYGPSGHAEISWEETCYNSLWQLVCKKKSGF